MKIHTFGDYYVWYCDWCDTTNQNQWSSLVGLEPTCAACHHPQGNSGIEEFGPLPRFA